MAAMTLLLVPLSSVFHINYESAFGERKIYLAYISITVLFFLSAAYIFFFLQDYFPAICGYSGDQDVELE